MHTQVDSACFVAQLHGPVVQVARPILPETRGEDERRKRDRRVKRANRRL